MTIDEVQVAAEAGLDALKASLPSLQNLWVETNDRCWQGVQNPSVLPADGDTGSVDPDLARSPLPSWSEFGVTFSGDHPFSVRCDEFVSGDAIGFHAVVVFQWGSDPVVIWSKKSRWEDGDWVDEDWGQLEMGPIA